MVTNKGTHVETLTPGTVIDRLSLLPVPAWLKNGSLISNDWVLELSDPEKKRRSSKRIIFDRPLMPGNRKLTDPAHLHDLLTCKLFVYFLIERMGYVSARSVDESFRNLLWLIRWREHSGLRFIRDLSEDWFEIYIEKLQDRGIDGIVPRADIARSYRDALLSGDASLPIYESGGKRRIRAEMVAAELGISIFKAAGREARDILYPVLEKLDPEAYKRTFGERRALRTDPQDKEGRLSLERMERLLHPWDVLWKLRGEFRHDPMEFQAFLLDDSPWLRARSSIGSRVRDSRTATVPAEQFCFVVDRALRWVLEYADPILGAVEAFAKGRRLFREKSVAERNHLALYLSEYCRPVLEGKPGSPWPIRPVFASRAHSRKPTERGIDLRDTILYLAVSCAIVIATFSARRREEIDSLRSDCIEFIDDEAWLSSWINKTLRHIDRIPIPSSVVKAVEILKRLCKEQDLATGLWLFEFHAPHKTRRPIYFNFPVEIKLFANYVGVPPLRDGTYWDFRAHQIRRFFAITYFWRFRFSSLTALSNFMCHFDPDMTRRYVTDAVEGRLQHIIEMEHPPANEGLGLKESLKDAVDAAEFRREEFEEGRRDFQISIYQRLLSEEEKAGGLGGQRLTSRLKQIISELTPMIEIDADLLESDALNKALYDFASQNWLEPNGLAHSYCSCSRTRNDLTAAACLIERSVRDPSSHEVPQQPDLRFAEELVCAGCVHSVLLDDNREHLTRRVEELDKEVNIASLPHLKAAQIKRQRLIRDHLEKWSPSRDPGADHD